MARPLVFENRFDVPLDYAFKWLTDFRPDDMKMADPKRAPTIRVSHLGGKILRDWSMMGMDFHTETTLEGTNRWTTVSTITRKGKPFAKGGVVETIRQSPTGTFHRAEVTSEPQTLPAKLLAPAIDAVSRSSIRKTFREAKARMETQHREGKPPTA